MPRKPRRPRRRNETDLPECFFEYFRSGEKPGPGVEGAFDLLMLRGPGSAGELAEIWKQERAGILASWLRTKPGTRPFAFWLFDSPEPRRRIGGQGAASFEKYPAIKPYYKFGLPVYWDEISESDPPKYESEATYLKRHGLLSISEQKRLTAADFKPESIK